MKSVEDYTEVKEAVAARQRAEQALADAKSNEAQALDARDRHESDQAEGILKGYSQSGHAKRQQRVEQMQSERRAAQEAVNLANEREKQARERARSYIKRAVSSEHYKALKELDAALSEAERANDKLRRIQNEGIDLLGQREAPERAHWQELTNDTDHDSRLKAWRKYFALDRTHEPIKQNGHSATDERGAEVETEDAHVW